MKFLTQLLVLALAITSARADNHIHAEDHNDNDAHAEHNHDSHAHDDHDEHMEVHAHTVPWGPALGAAATVNVASLVGVAALGLPALRATKPAKQTSVHASGFASGALLSAAFMLIFPESLALIGTGYAEEAPHGALDYDDHDDHRRRALNEAAHGDEHVHEEKGAAHADHVSIDAVWRWGTLILVGLSLVLVLDLAISTFVHSAARERRAGDVNKAAQDEDATAKTTADDGAPAATIDPHQQTEATSTWRVIAAITVDDLFHNFADGVFIGSAFLTCGSAFGWAVVFGTIARELSQELADFLLLTTICGLRPWVALALSRSRFRGRPLRLPRRRARARNRAQTGVRRHAARVRRRPLPIQRGGRVHPARRARARAQAQAGRAGALRCRRGLDRSRAAHNDHCD
jgi:zinc transporter ZupT